jgi:GntR family transcriptional regulator, transcriptional repressor for pyruvate dehydrogenase complex
MSDVPAPHENDETPPAAKSNARVHAPENEAKLSNRIYEMIIEKIIRDDFSQGSRLPPEVELARLLGASRPVVREALARLRDDGIVASRRGSGSYILRRPDAALLRFAPLGSIADIQRCFEFRTGLEGAAAALAAERWQDEDLNEIKAALYELDICIRENRLGVDADERFHRAVARATRNSFHAFIQESLRPYISFGMNLTRNLSLLRPEAQLRLVQDEHVIIVEAIEAREPEAARLAMENHINNARHRMFEGGLT